MALNKQVHLYGIDTAYFYSHKEEKIQTKLNAMYIERAKYKKKKNKTEEDSVKIKEINKLIKKYKVKLVNKLEHNKGKRKLNPMKLKDSDIISVFDSALTRTIGCGINDVTKDVFIIQVYFFQVMESIIKNGFTYNGEEYIPYTASAGQIRLKKFVVIKKSVYDRIQNTITCGLPVEEINKRGGVNTNKYLAYLALQNSATDIWEGFDIDRSIVVDDFETNVNGVVDFINYQTYNINKQVNMDVPVPHTDGAGIYLYKKNRMVRLPWIKGLMVYTPYDQFLKMNSIKYPNCHIVKDIYGKEWDVFKDDIQVIFTKSQFKMYKYYDSWDDYKTKFKLHNCQAGYCNEEENNPSFATINYQMLQTLTDVSDAEVLELVKETSNRISKIGHDKMTMMKILGADKRNVNKNSFQQALELYPEMLRDVYSKEVLKDVKKSLVKDARSGKLFLDSHYTFICPDVYGFMEWLFLGIENPQGLLKNGEVSCKLYRKSDKLDVLRSPHLYFEHAIRNNVTNQDTNRWFATNGIYVSSHDLISKVLQFDVDGDKALVTNDPLLIRLAERNRKDIVPLYYEMKKAVVEDLNPNSIYKGLSMAYTNTTIGLYSNSITKVWNNPEPNLDVVKLLCLESNFSIDSAKTLFFIERPENVDNLISRYTKSKVPHFFIHAKDKLEEGVEPLNETSIMGRVEKAIPSDKLQFKKHGLGTFDYTMLMRNKSIMIDDGLCELYDKLSRSIGVIHGVKKDASDEDDDIDYLSGLYFKAREELVEYGLPLNNTIDILVAHMYGKNRIRKAGLWSMFGEEMLENLKYNIRKSNLNGTISCDKCGKRVKKEHDKMLYCNDCSKDIKKEQDKIALKRLRDR